MGRIDPNHPKPGSPRTPFGRVSHCLSSQGRLGALVSVGCGRADSLRRGAFVDYSRKLAEHVRDQAPAHIEGLAEQDWAAGGLTVAQFQQQTAEELQDVISVQRIVRIESREGWVFGFEHPSGTSGALLALQTQAPRAQAARVALLVTGMILHEPVGEWGVGEQGTLIEWFDATGLALRPWEPAGGPPTPSVESAGPGQTSGPTEPTEPSESSESSAQKPTIGAVVEDRLGPGSRIEAYACFRPGS